MLASRYCCVLLAALLLEALSTGTESDPKSSCLGETFVLFRNITFANPNTFATLSTNGQKQMVIARWTKPNDVIEPNILAEFKEKFSLDMYGNILIHNITISDEAKYFIKHEVGNLSMTSHVQLYVMVAPSKYCKPTITYMDNNLTASLEGKDCGKPNATVYWMKHPGISNIRDPVVQLQPGKETGTYHACIEGTALQCAKTSLTSKYCSDFTIEGVTGTFSKSACFGDSVQVFQNVTFKSGNVASLYFRLDQILIGRWSMQKDNLKFSRHNGYTEKVFHDSDGNIYIRNVTLIDEGRYTLQFGGDTSSKKSEVQLDIIVPPSTHCQPEIIRMDNSLKASLKHKDCGKPEGSVQWLDHHGISNNSGTVVYLRPGDEAGTYYACIKSLALICAKTSTPSVYCSHVKIEKHTNPIELSSMRAVDIVITVIVSFIFIMGSAMIIILVEFRKKKARQKIPSLCEQGGDKAEAGALLSAQDARFICKESNGGDKAEAGALLSAQDARFICKESNADVWEITSDKSKGQQATKSTQNGETKIVHGNSSNEKREKLLKMKERERNSV